MITKSISQDKNIFIGLIIYTILLIFFCSKMSPLYPINEWSDINLYFNIGKAMMNGKTLYSEVFDHKGPVIFIIYGIGYLISNTSFFGVFVIECLLWSCMVITAYMAARLYLEKIYSFVVAVVFPVFMLTHTDNGGSAEEFIAIFQVASLFLFIKFFKEKDPLSHSPKYMLVHGIMCALVIFTKINLVVFWIFPLAGIFIYLFLRKNYTNIVRNILAFVLGLLIVALPIILYLWLSGALAEAWNIYIVLNSRYAELGSVSEIASKILSSIYLRLRFDVFAFLLVLTGAIYFPIKFIHNQIGKIALILSFLILYAMIFVSSRFIFYYSIPYYVYGLMGLIVLAHHLVLSSKKRIYLLCAILALLWGINKKNFFRFELSELITRDIKKTSLDIYTDIIAKEEDKSVMNLGLDEHGAILTKLNIVPSVKYFMSPNLLHDIYPDMRDEQAKYIENKEVNFILVAIGSTNYDYFNSLSKLNENYYRLDSLAAPSGKVTYLYKRKDN